MSHIDVSIIIVNWNTRDLVRNCISSIHENSGTVNYETIMIDNASDDGSAETISNTYPQVIVIENSSNRGFAAANNQGIAIARGRYILLLNSDTIALDHAIEKAVAFADSHPQVAVFGCCVRNPDGTLQRTCFMFPSVVNMLLSSSYLYKLFPKSHFFGREQMTWWNRDDFREVDVVTGCFMLVRREAIEQAGPMDEFFFMYGEETDWCYRFAEAGWKRMYTPDAEIVHLGGASSKQIKPDMVLQLRAGMLLFFKKHRSWLSYGLACLLVGLFFLLRLPFWSARAVLSKNTRQSDLQTVKTYAAGAIKAVQGWRALSLAK